MLSKFNCLLILCTVLIVSCKMDHKKFTSQNGWFSMTIPADWEEFDDDDGTYTFFNSKVWTGNFRVTPFRWTKADDQYQDKASKYITSELTANKEASKIILGNYNCIHYKKSLTENNEEIVVYYWMTGEKNKLVLCSFAIDKKQEDTSQNESELQKVQNIIKSITLH